MTLTRKINYKTHKKTRRQSGGGRFSDFIRSFFSRGSAPRPSGSPPTSSGPPPPPPPIPADIVRLFNARMPWQIVPTSTYYEVLNVAPDADAAAINKSFTRNIARLLHPDKFSTDAAKAAEYNPVFQAVVGMRDILLDPDARAQYDALLGMYPPPGGPPPPPPPPAGPAPGLDLSFMATHQPNPLERRQNGPIPQPIIGTRVGAIIQGFMQHINDAIDDGRLPNDNPQVISVLNFCVDMLSYPESSNLENYILLVNLFATTADQNDLINSLNDVLNEKKLRETKSKLGFTDNFNLFDVVQLTMPGVALDPTRIRPDRLLSLMVLSSRLCPIYKLRTNPEAELFSMLNDLFDNGDGPNFDPNNIYRIFLHFIRTSPVITLDYIKNLINGKTVYNIYKSNYFDKETEISERLIKARLDSWLRAYDTVETPISFLFNKYSNEVKARMNKNAGICNVIANFSDKLGEPTTPAPLLPKSVFNIDENDDVDFDKLNAFLTKLGPAAASSGKKPKKGKRSSSPP